MGYMQLWRDEDGVERGERKKSPDDNYFSSYTLFHTVNKANLAGIQTQSYTVLIFLNNSGIFVCYYNRVFGISLIIEFPRIGK
jgi:hypothetical protein